jgi:hypothetical protein
MANKPHPLCEWAMRECSKLASRRGYPKNILSSNPAKDYIIFKFKHHCFSKNIKSRKGNNKTYTKYAMCHACKYWIGHTRTGKMLYNMGCGFMLTIHICDSYILITNKNKCYEINIADPDFFKKIRLTLRKRLPKSNLEWDPLRRGEMKKWEEKS